MDALPAHRPRSIRSVASNSSIGSGVSLSRRARTRTRSKTVTGEVPRSPLPSDLPYLGGAVVQEPENILDASLEAPERPPRSPHRLLSDPHSGGTPSSQDVDPTFVELTQSTASRPSKASKQASSLPHLDTGYRPPPSAFSRDPALTPVLNVRDSVSTQQSAISSSLYPASTSTASTPTSPQSLAPEPLPPTFAVSEPQEYDGDDVAYRLRLLVKNNYFLPPAHAKPSAADFGPAPDQKKAGAPTFLDIFRVGKARSKPTTPTGPGPAASPLAPMLRTTSESIAALRPPPRVSGQFGHPSPPLSAPPSRGRVVVVREKMQDISVAAKQAEQDLKTRGARIDQGSQKTAPLADNHVIDPTDAVDIPLPSSSYPFPVQASALHGLGVLESLGAAVLADHLPPSQNPNLSVSYDEVEDTWRKAILKQAVHHSLDNTPDASTFSHRLGTPTPLNSPTPNAARNAAAQKMIAKRIAAPPVADAERSPPPAPTHTRQKSGQSQAGRSMLGVPHPTASYQRAETPSGPMTPLGPPPRRAFMHPAYSHSQTELSSASAQDARPADGGRPTLRRTMSSPLLAEGPHPRYSQATFASFDTIARSFAAPSEHLLSDDDDDGAAPSFRGLALSRPSLSVYSQASQSPTTSAFQDMLNHPPHSSTSGGGSRFSEEQPRPSISRFSEEQQHAFAANPAARAAMSPPPRMSSSLAHAALPPPPRSSSFRYQLNTSSSSGTRSYHTQQPHEEEGEELEILAPEPSTPPLPLPDGRGFGFSNRSAIYIDDDADLPPALRSAPGPATAPSFFDSIQAQPNAMDDLESSDESVSDDDGDDDDAPAALPPPPVLPASRPRVASSASEGPRGSPALMRHGNFSAPYVRAGDAPRVSMLPVGNTVRAVRSDVVAGADFFRYAQEHPPAPVVEAGASTAPTDEGVAAWRNNQRAQEAVRKLDGLLLQHMEDEKDTIKRIATTLAQTAPAANRR
ncbi:hypothetical protein HYPSUDRAFT_40351, partial [Hypholoma sublateritium FD-334 SS-4]